MHEAVSDWLRRGTLGLGLVGAFALVGPAPLVHATPASSSEGEPTDAPSTADEPTAAVEPEAEPAAESPTPAPPTGPMVDDGILPCGLRVIIAQDASLPVASVVLAIDTGTEDDPPSQPGLVHALAYQLLQGNRELPPWGASALVHDRGGLATMAVGPAQTRYESIVPISALTDVLWAESQRLRAPTVSAELWASSLRWARRDRARAWRVSRAALAAAHGVAGLDHNGRSVSAALQTMVPRAIGKALADRFRYDLATLVVVSPHRPEEVRAQIEPLFSDLPAQPHAARDRQPQWRTGTVPRATPIEGEKGERYVWPVAPDPGSLGWATVWCKAINRQRRLPAEPARARLRCHLDVDPRRATLVLVASGVEDRDALVQARIARLEQGADDRLIERQRLVVERDWTLALRSALPLAQRLATAAALEPTDTAVSTPSWTSRPQRVLTGQHDLATPWQTGQSFGPHLQPGAALHLVPLGKSDAKTKAKPSTTAKPATPASGGTP